MKTRAKSALPLAIVLAMGALGMIALAPTAGLAASPAETQAAQAAQAPEATSEAAISETEEQITTYVEVRITPAIVHGLHTYFGQRENIVGKQRHRLMLYHYPELLQPPRN